MLQIKKENGVLRNWKGNPFTNWKQKSNQKWEMKIQFENGNKSS